MGIISKETFKRLFLLYTIGQFKNGVYGKLRLNKIVYLILRKHTDLIPFEFKHDRYGQHSDDLDTINEQLSYMNHTTVTPLEGGRGNRYSLERREIMDFYRVVLGYISPRLRKAVDEIVEQNGYLHEEDLRKKAYCDEVFLKSEEGNILLKENLPERIKVSLPEEDCEDLELSLDPKFVTAMRHL
jgi:hypothetical protein